MTTLHWIFVSPFVALLPDPFRTIAGILVLSLYMLATHRPVIE